MMSFRREIGCEMPTTGWRKEFTCLRPAKFSGYAADFIIGIRGEMGEKCQPDERGRPRDTDNRLVKAVPEGQLLYRLVDKIPSRSAATLILAT